MAHQWYWLENGQQRGPVDDTGLKDLAAKGRLKPTDLIRRDGFPKWFPAAQVKGLFQPDAVRPTPPAPAAPAAAKVVEPVGAPEAAPRDGQATSRQTTARTTRTPSSAMPHQNLYRALNVPDTASVDDVKKAINRELRLWSNRTNAPQIERRQEAERMVKLLEQAEAILLDPAQRAAYDRQLMSAPTEERELEEGNLGGMTDLVQEARRLLVEGNIPDALFVAEKATQRDGRNAEAWAVLGEARFRWGDIEDAIHAYKQATKLRPKEASYYFDFGSVLESAERPADALQQYQRAAQIEPGTTMYRAAVGSLLIKNEQFSDGIAILEQCVREKPDNPTYQWFLAIAYSESSISGWTHVGEGHPLVKPAWYATEFRHITEAQECLNKALALNFDDPELLSHLEERRRSVDQNLQRAFMCNWWVVVIVALIGILTMWGGAIAGIFFPILTGLYVFSTYTPQFMINRRILQGKHFNEFAFLGSVSDAFGQKPGRPDWLNILLPLMGFCLVYSVVILIMPFVVALNIYKNWISARRPRAEGIDIVGILVALGAGSAFLALFLPLLILGLTPDRRARADKQTIVSPGTGEKSKPERLDVVPPVGGSGTLVVSAYDVCAEFIGNQNAAEKKYGGKKLEVTGKVLYGKSRTFEKDADLTLNGETGGVPAHLTAFLSIVVYFDDDLKREAAKIFSGQVITIRGTFDSNQLGRAGRISMKKCDFLKVIKVVTAETFTGQIKKVEGDKITVNITKQGEATLTIAGDLKVAMAKFNKETRKQEPGEPIEGGLKNELFSKAKVTAHFTIRDDGKVSQILVLVGGKKKG